MGALREPLLMLAATAVLTCMHATVRHVSDGMHSFEITFFRNLFGLFTILPLAIRAGIGSLRNRQPGLQMLRSGFGLIAMLTWFYGLSVVPIAQATALSFTAVIFGSIGAALVLGERMRLRRWSAVVAGFIGVPVILRPGFGEADPAALVVVLSSICWADALRTVKRLSTTDTVVCIVTWNSVLLMVLSLPVAIPVWVTPSTEQEHRKFKRRFSSRSTLSRCQRVVNRVSSQ